MNTEKTHTDYKRCFILCPILTGAADILRFFLKVLIQIVTDRTDHLEILYLLNY